MLEQPVLLSSEKPCHLSQRENNFSPGGPGDPQTILPAPRPLPSFPTGATLTPPVMMHTSETSDFELCCLCKLVVVSLSPFPSKWFWGRVFLLQSPVHSLSFSTIWAPSPPQHSQFSPPDQPSAPPIFHDMATFLPIDVQFVLSVLNFLGVQNDLVLSSCV